MFLKYLRMIASISFICFIWMPSMAQASEPVVEKVTVSITANPAPPDRIAKRMATSVGTVGEQMLVGRNINDVAIGKTSYEKLIKEIFDRVLVGYWVQSVRLVPASDTTIQVEVAPWGEVVHDVALEVDVGNFSPELINLVKKDMGNIEDRINDVLVGLPIDAVDWAGGVSKNVIREILDSKLPEFRANFDIIPGARTVVKVSLSPLGPTVRDINVSLRSHTIPNVVLSIVRGTVDQASKNLVGVPVAFVERHRADLTARLTDAALRHPIVKRYALTLTPAIYAGRDTDIALDVETDQYKVALEGYMDMGRREDNIFFQLHVGKIINKRDEVFMEAHFIPSTVEWEFNPGWAHFITTGTSAGIKHNISNQYNILWIDQDVNRNITLRFEHTPASDRDEFAIRYKLHDFLSAEYVATKEDKWIRLIGSL